MEKFIKRLNGKKFDIFVGDYGKRLIQNKKETFHKDSNSQKDKVFVVGLKYQLLLLLVNSSILLCYF